MRKWVATITTHERRTGEEQAEAITDRMVHLEEYSLLARWLHTKNNNLPPWVTRIKTFTHSFLGICIHRGFIRDFLFSEVVSYIYLIMSAHPHSLFNATIEPHIWPQMFFKSSDESFFFRSFFEQKQTSDKRVWE